jgi:hypothetical protein
MYYGLSQQQNNNMKEQKVIITDFADSVNDYLKNGWEVISVTSSHHTSFKYFCFVIQKQN